MVHISVLLYNTQKQK